MSTTSDRAQAKQDKADQKAEDAAELKREQKAEDKAAAKAQEVAAVAEAKKLAEPKQAEHCRCLDGTPDKLRH